MKAIITGLVASALVVAAPAFAQNMNYSGTTSKPGVGVMKDDQTNMTTTKRAKKHTASVYHRHHTKAMKSRAQTTGSGSNSAKPEKDDTTPKSQ